MTERLARAVMEITTDTAGFLRGIDESISKSEFFQLRINTLGKDLQKFGRSTENVGRSLSLGLTAPLLGAATAAVKMASDAVESGNKFDVVFGGSADRVRQRLQQLKESIPLTTGELEGLAAGVQNLVRPMGLSETHAADMSVQIVELAGDLGSFNNIPTAKVLEDIQSAFAGSSEPMQKYAVDTKVANLEAIALRNGLIQQGEELTKAARAQAILIAIQEGGALAMGDAARTADEFANATKLLWRDLRDLGEMLGATIIPLVRPYVLQLREWLAGLQQLTPEQQLLIVRTGALAAALGPALIVVGKMAIGLGAVVKATGTVARGFGSLAGSLGGSLSTIARATSMLGARGGLAMTLRLVGAALGGPVGVIALLATLALSFRPVREALAGFLGATIDTIQKMRQRWASYALFQNDLIQKWVDRQIGINQLLGKDTEALENKLADLILERSRLIAEMAEEHEDAADVVVDSFGTAGDAAAVFGADVATATAKVEDQTPKLGQLAAALEPLNGVYSGAALGVLELADAYDELARRQALIATGANRVPDLIPAEDIVSIGRAVDDLGESAERSQGTFSRAFSAMGASLKSLLDGITGGGGVGGALSNIGAGIAEGIGQQISQAMTKAFAQIASMVGSLMQQLTTKLFGDSKSASTGASIGSVAGGIVGMYFGPVGSMLGSMLGGVIGGAIGKAFQQASAIEHAVEQFGFELSEALSDQIDQIAEAFGGDLDAAIRTSLDDIIAELGVTSGNFDAFVTTIHQIFSSVDEGAFTVSEAIGHIGDALQQLIPQMAAAGGSAMDLQTMFSDMISRARAEGQDLSVAVIPTIEAAIEAMIASGVEGVGELVMWLESLGVSIEGIAEPLSKSEQAWNDWVANNGSGYQEATRHNRAYFEAIATQMGLTGETFDAWVNGMLRNQREAEKERVKSNREMWRQQAIDAGLSGEQITEYVNAQIRLRRKEEREAAREAKKDRRESETEQIDSAKLVRDRQIHFIEQIGAAWSDMYAGVIADAQAFADSVSTGGGPSYTTGGNTAPAGSFADGTGFKFMDFGTESLALLHGPEAVINRDQADDLVGMLAGGVASGVGAAMAVARSTSSGGGSDAAAIRELRNDFRGLQREMQINNTLFFNRMPGMLEGALTRANQKTVVRR